MDGVNKRIVVQFLLTDDKKQKKQERKKINET